MRNFVFYITTVKFYVTIFVLINLSRKRDIQDRPTGEELPHA
jgi:hypothetical protein